MQKSIALLTLIIITNNLSMNPPSGHPKNSGIMVDGFCTRVMLRAIYSDISISQVDTASGTAFQITVEESKFSKHFAASPNTPHDEVIDLRQEMMAACVLGKHELVTHLHAQKPDLINAQCRQNWDWNPLLYAAACGHRQTIETLVGLGADLTRRNLRINADAAMLARRCDHSDLADYLSALMQTHKNIFLQYH